MFRTFYMVAFLIFCCSTSCVEERLGNRLVEHDKTQSVTLELLQKSYSLKKRDRISWSESIAILEKENITLQRARDQIANAKKQRKDQWLALIPKIQGIVGLSQSLSGLAVLNTDDIDTRVLASFNIPNPLRFYTRSYALALQSLQAEWTYELTRRQLYTQLYTNFLEERLLNERYQKLVENKKLIDKASIEELPGKIASLEQEQRLITRTRGHRRLALNRLLNTSGRHWQPHGEIPTVSYKKGYKTLKFGEKFGKLGLKLQTLQLESAALSVLNVKLGQLPNWSQGLSSPLIFSSDENNDTGLTADDFFLFTSLSKTIDLTDILGSKNLQSAKVRANYIRDQLKISMESEIQRLELIKQSYSHLQVEKNKLTQRIIYLKKKTHKGALDTVLKEYEEFQLLEERKQNLDDQITRLDIQFWLWDDVYWNKN